MSPQPFIKDGVSEGVEQDEDGVIGGEVGLSPSSIQEQMGQVVETSHYGVVVPLGGAVSCQNHTRRKVEMLHSTRGVKAP